MKVTVNFEKSILVLFSVFLFSLSAFSNVKPNTLFSDNMVLQQGVKVPVWGKADENETVTVEFCGQKVSVVAKDGKWFVQLTPLKIGGPFEMIIKGQNTIKITNILVGEVWLCSGQSNMERRMEQAMVKREYLWKEEMSHANFPKLRQYTVPPIPSTTKVEDANGKWDVCDSITVRKFTAVGYFFAKQLSKDLKTPVGLVYSAYGGSQADRWISRVAMENNPELKSVVADYDNSIKQYTASLEKYKLQEPALLNKWREDSIVAKAEKKPLKGKPHAPNHPDQYGACAGLYNGMLYPLIPFAMKGVLWYQGESDRMRWKLYEHLFTELIADWRNKWNQPEWPFLFVQLPGFKDYPPEIRETQMKVWQKTQNTAMVVVSDFSDSTNMHPVNKKPVGERLELAALAIAYKQEISYSGPVYKSMKIKGNSIELSFDLNNLNMKGDKLNDFVIAGEDQIFLPAAALIKGNKVIVSSPLVANPVAVRMGWKGMPNINLCNKEGLLAPPFRTDNFEKKVGYRK